MGRKKGDGPSPFLTLSQLRSVAVPGMPNGASQPPFRPALGDISLVPRTSCGRSGAPHSGVPQRPQMTRRLVGCICIWPAQASGTFGPLATAAMCTRLGLPRATRVVLRTSRRAAGTGHFVRLCASASLLINNLTLTAKKTTITMAATTIKMDIQRTGSQFIMLLSTFMLYPLSALLTAVGGKEPPPPSVPSLTDHHPVGARRPLAS